MAFPISKSFWVDPLKGWRYPPCKDALDDWLHAWHTSWRWRFSNLRWRFLWSTSSKLHFHVNSWNDLSRKHATLGTQERQFWWGTVAQILSKWMAFRLYHHKYLDFLSVIFIEECNASDIPLAWLKHVHCIVEVLKLISHASENCQVNHHSWGGPNIVGNVPKKEMDKVRQRLGLWKD